MVIPKDSLLFGIKFIQIEAEIRTNDLFFSITYSCIYGKMNFIFEIPDTLLIMYSLKWNLQIQMYNMYKILARYNCTSNNVL